MKKIVCFSTLLFAFVCSGQVVTKESFVNQVWKNLVFDSSCLYYYLSTTVEPFSSPNWLFDSFVVSMPDSIRHQLCEGILLDPNTNFALRHSGCLTTLQSGNFVKENWDCMQLKNAICLSRDSLNNRFEVRTLLQTFDHDNTLRKQKKTRSKSIAKEKTRMQLIERATQPEERIGVYFTRPYFDLGYKYALIEVSYVYSNDNIYIDFLGQTIMGTYGTLFKKRFLFENTKGIWGKIAEFSFVESR